MYSKTSRQITFNSSLSIFVLILSFHSWSQTYTMNRPVDDTLVKEITELVKEVLEPDFSIEYTCTTYDLYSSLEKIPKGIDYSLDYKQKQEEQLQKTPENAFVWNNLGNYYNSVNNHDEAVSHFLKALQYLDGTVKKDSSLYFSFRGLIKMNVGIDGGLEDFEQALSMNPSDSIAGTFLPMALINSKQYDRGEKYFLGMIEKTHGIDQATWFLFYAMVNLMEQINSELFTKYSNDEINTTDFDKIFDLTKTESVYHKYKKNEYLLKTRNLMSLLPMMIKYAFFVSNKVFQPTYSPAERQKISELKKYFSPGAKPLVNEFTRLKAVAFITMFEGNLDSAAQLFRKAIDIFPGRVYSSEFNINLCQQALLGIGMIQKDYPANIRLLNEMVAMYKDHVLSSSTLTNLAKCYLKENDYENFKKITLDAEKLSKTDFETLRLLTHVCFLENSSQIDYYLRKASENVTENSQYINLSCQVGLYFLARGNAAEAHKYFQQARDTDPEEPCELCDRVEKEYVRIE